MPDLAALFARLPAHDEQAMPVERVQALLHEAIALAGPVAGPFETVPLHQALDRVLAVTVDSPIDVPAHDNAAMDGHALDGSALRPGEPTELDVVGRALAGQPFLGSTPVRGCVRIMTGAVMPPGLDTVVPQELCETLADGRVRIPAGAVRRGDHRRARGEDLAIGRPALLAGRRLRPADLGLLASLGLTSVVLHRRLRVACFSTGDELRAAGEPLPPGCIYDSNRQSLLASVQRLGMEAIDLGIVPDQPEALTRALQSACRQADVVLTSGGVSAGDADHTRDVIARLGQAAYCKLAMRPGRPFAFGALAGGTPDQPRTVWLFGLPGNPVASLVSFHVLVRQALERLAGADARPPVVLTARSLEAIRKRAGRSEYLRGRLERDPDGELAVRLTGAQGSGILRSLSEADALVVLPQAQGPVAPGDRVEVWPFDGLI
ncbi:molybdopterin molybdotransferase MoeA [Sphaerotilus hippei]|uniref:molybdopterin molybdotransferase MoeA n=1 Tax=Sphaerotilus hippei TaxID=744406 RepID=UPI000D76B6B3|nr:gephyrin-like molybdotransferase Glp [Sphaerotilus hippei]